MSLFTILVPAIDWVLYNKKEAKLFTIVMIADNLSLVISCIILIWGFMRLIKVVTDVFVDKTIIVWHIIAYFFVVVANIV